MEITVKVLEKIDADMFDKTYQVKKYCAERKNCHDCKIWKHCRNVEEAFGSDISSIDVARIGNDFYLIGS